MVSSKAIDSNLWIVSILFKIYSSAVNPNRTLNNQSAQYESAHLLELILILLAINVFIIKSMKTSCSYYKRTRFLSLKYSRIVFLENLCCINVFSSSWGRS